MKKVSLLGDSIREIGYGLKVPELLGEEYTVYQPDDNCQYSKYTLLRVHQEWAEHMVDSDVIHWNNGLWDVCDRWGDGTFSTYEEYEMNMVRIARFLKTLGKKVIFATITPVNPAHPNQNNDTIKSFNERIVPTLKKEGIIINDLHSVIAKDIDSYICEDKIHLSQKGIEVAGKHVADFIKKVIAGEIVAE
jgi:lysophospholipase L1-like esterase